MLSSLASCAASIAKPRPEAEVEAPFEDCSSEDIHAELARILSSPRFEASERNRRFLTYVIEETLAGRAGRIKAYNIATEVFARDVNFDAQLDPVVRMEARRLRRALERFYLTTGRSSRVRIAMPKGGYVPEFRNVILFGSSPAANGPTTEVYDNPASDRCASIVVARFDAEGDESTFVRFNHGFTDQIMVGLSRYPELSVFGPSILSRNPPTVDLDPITEDASVDFLLTGSTALFEGVLNIKAVLMRARTGKVLWGQSFEHRLEPGKILELRDRIANAIVRAVAEPFGAIFPYSGELDPAEMGEAASAQTLAWFYRYRRSYRRGLFDTARLCLERAVTGCPEDSEVTACLSQVYTDAHRFGFAGSEPPAAFRQQAAILARRAIELNPNSARGHHAHGLARWYLSDVAASVKAMQTAVGLNPNASDAVADLGLMWSLCGDWTRAAPLLEEARDRKIAYSSAWHTGLSLCNFVNGRFEDALVDALEIDAPDVAHGFVVRAISQIRLGRRAEAAESVGRIVALASTRARGVLAEFGGRNVHADLTSRVSAALRDAGLPRELVGE